MSLPYRQQRKFRLKVGHPDTRAVHGGTDGLLMLQIFEYTDCDLFACVC